MSELQTAAIVETVLSGVPLPAGKGELLAYAQAQEAPAEALEALEEIPEDEYRSLNEVGEAVAGVQPAFDRGDPDRQPSSPEPKATGEGEVPGKEAYTDARAQPGSIRDEPETLEYEEQLVREPEES